MKRDNLMKNLQKPLLQLNKKFLSFLIFFLYLTLLILVSYYHEPWHDEGQAWLIARDDSLWQLLTVTTHYEGHPPLWHLCLMPFAKLGIPFPFGLKAMNILFVSLAMKLLIFKSPFPWYLRFSLPFTYFFFYQYGVSNRVYSLLMFAIMLVAYYYPQRQEHPYKLAAALALAAGSQAYGMMFACGVAMAWLWEIIVRERINRKHFLTALHKSGEIQSLGVLLLISLFFVLCMWPYKDTEFTSTGAKTGFLQNIFYLFTVMPGQILASNSIQNNFLYNNVKFFFSNFKIYREIILQQGFYGILIAFHWFVSYTYGAFLNIGLFYVCKKVKKLPLFSYPLFLMNFLAALVYWNIYHSGVWVCFYVFILWQLWSDKNNIHIIEENLKQKLTYKREFFFIKVGLMLCCLCFFFTNFLWTWQASKNDVLFDVDISRAIADYIKQNKLTDYTIWLSASYEKKKELAFENVVTGDLAVNCYFPKNIFQNLDGGMTKHAYHDYKLLPREKYVNSVKKFGQPEFVLGEDNNLDYIFFEPAKYIPIKEFKSYVIWKNTANKASLCLYAREDMLKKLTQLHRIEGKKELGAE